MNVTRRYKGFHLFYVSLANGHLTSFRGLTIMANMFANDASISYSATSISTTGNVVNEDLESLKIWLGESKLSLNVAKTHYIVIGSRNKIRTLNQSNTTMPSI